MTELPTKLRTFVDDVPWVFAKTYAETWPHEYIVRERVNENLFVELVEHVRANGYKGYFYKKELIYFGEDGLTYWTMGAPVAETTIINRCPKENTFEERKKAGTLPI